MSNGNIFEDSTLPPDMLKRLNEDFEKEYRPPLSLDNVCRDCGNKKLHCVCRYFNED